MFGRLPKVHIDGGWFNQGKFYCTGSYADLPPGNFQHPQWQPFRVNFNGRWIAVQPFEYGEEWGWKAQDLVSRNKEQVPAPDIRTR